MLVRKDPNQGFIRCPFCNRRLVRVYKGDHVYCGNCGRRLDREEPSGKKWYRCPICHRDWPQPYCPVCKFKIL